MSQSIQFAEALSLRELLPAAQFSGAEDVHVRSCTSDSRVCGPGDVFVALRGTRSDGHDFVQDAIRRGAQAIVAERALDVGVAVCLVPDAREAYGQICQALAGYPSRSIRVIGITGTNGKTTTTQLTASVLAAAGFRVGTLGTLGYCDSLETSRGPWTTPPAQVCAQWLSRMVKHHCTHAVIEVSSHALDQERIAGVELAQACLTNLRRDHLDYHGSLLKYHHAKTGLFKYLKPAGLAVVNLDDPASAECMPLLPGGVLTVGMTQTADVTARLVERSKSEQTILLSAGDMAVPVRTAMIGDHHIQNCLVAAAAGLAEGIDLLTIARGLEQVQRVSGRLERIECGQPFGVFVDFAHTPDALETALNTLREVTVGRILCVFGAGGNRDGQKRPLMGRAVESLADVAIVTSDNPRLEDPRTIASQVLAGFRSPGDARWIPDRAEAIHYALSLAGPDDCVLVAGRGHEEFQIIGRERVPLDDREVTRRWLYNLEPDSRYGELASVSNS